MTRISAQNILHHTMLVDLTTLSIFVERKAFCLCIILRYYNPVHFFFFLSFTVASYDQLSLLHLALWLQRNYISVLFLMRW